MKLAYTHSIPIVKVFWVEECINSKSLIDHKSDPRYFYSKLDILDGMETLEDKKDAKRVREGYVTRILKKRESEKKRRREEIGESDSDEEYTGKSTHSKTKKRGDGSRKKKGGSI